MDKYQIEQLYQLEQRKKAMVENIAEKIEPAVGEYLQELIAWQTDDEYGWDALEGDMYLQYCNEVREKVLKELLYGGN